MNPVPALNNPLSGLRDIHLPAPVSFWPPAPGWWMLAVGLLVFLALGLWWWRRYRRHRYRRQAMKALQDLRRAWQDGQSETELLGGISILLRRVAITRYGRRPVAALHGEAWLAFLDRTGRGTDFQTRGQELVDAPYRPGPVNSTETILDLASRWVKGQA